MIQTLWHKLEALIKESEPEILEKLNPLATSEDISELEKYLKLKLPNDFVQFLKIHNGIDLPHHHEILSTEYIPGTLGSWNDLLDGGDFDDDHQRVKADPGVKKVWWSKKWIPFTADGGGNSFCFDMDPAAGGHQGQVIMVWHDSESRTLIASNFTEWLEKTINEITERIEADKKKKEKKEDKPSWWQW